MESRLDDSADDWRLRDGENDVRCRAGLVGGRVGQGLWPETLVLALPRVTGRVRGQYEVNLTHDLQNPFHPSQTRVEPRVPVLNPWITRTRVHRYGSLAGTGAGQPSDTRGLTRAIA